MSVGELSGFVYLFTLLVFPLRIVGYVFSEFPKSRSGMDRVNEMFAEAIQPDPTFEPDYGSSTAIRLDGVSLDFDGVRVLDDVSLSIPKGSCVAVVGPTGSGKTSLLHVMAGLLRPSRGSVSSSGQRTSIVLQEPFLFDGTVLDNVTLGDSDPSLLESALRLSRADEFVSELPDGVSTSVGERGVGLSGGQRQRLCLARALCRENDLLLLDDTTSALDTRNEIDVLSNLQGLLPRTTLVMATSRPSVIRHAEMIVFIRNGRVEQVGTSTELMKLSSEYRTLIESYEGVHDDE
jgi:ABC-type multidrug transport system fused ATPase/permease subunit